MYYIWIWALLVQEGDLLYTNIIRSEFYLLISMTIVVMTAAKNTKPPNTPNEIMPPERKTWMICTWKMYFLVKKMNEYITQIKLSTLGADFPVILNLSGNIGSGSVKLNISRVGNFIVNRRPGWKLILFVYLSEFWYCSHQQRLLYSHILINEKN